LKAAFSKLIVLLVARWKEALMADRVHFSDDILQWNISFTKPMHEWEVESITSFFSLLYSLRLRQGGGTK
jgi:hypothetical protein